MSIYTLRRESDGAGDSGRMSMAIWYDTKDSVTNHEHGARPQVGVAMRVGSHFAGTFTAQDWWQTTRVTEILEDTPTLVRFRTTNSVYTWTVRN